MKRHKLIFVALIIFGGFGGSLWLFAPAEPKYGGKKLSVWLEQQKMVDGRIVLSETATGAVQALGTNAIPPLLQMLRRSDSKLKLWLAKHLWRFYFMREHFPLNATWRLRAVLGFRALGEDAKSAIPELVTLAVYSSDPGVQSSAINALTEAHEDAIAEIAKATLDPNHEVRKRAVFALGCLRQAPHIGIPALTNAINDSDNEVRAMAAAGLGPYAKQAWFTVPQLTILLTDTNARVRGCAADSLTLIQTNPATR